MMPSVSEAIPSTTSPILHDDEYYYVERGMYFSKKTLNIAKTFISIVEQNPNTMGAMSDLLSQYEAAILSYQESPTAENWQLCEDWAHTIVERWRQILTKLLSPPFYCECSKLALDFICSLLSTLVSIHPRNSYEIEDDKFFPLDQLNLCRIEVKYILPLSDGMVYDIRNLLAMISEKRKFENTTFQPFLSHDIEKIKEKAAACGSKLFKLPSLLEIMKDRSWDLAMLFINDDLLGGELLEFVNDLQNQDIFYSRELRRDNWMDPLFIPMTLLSFVMMLLNFVMMPILFVMGAVALALLAFVLVLFSFSMQVVEQLVNRVCSKADAAEEKIKKQVTTRDQFFENQRSDKNRIYARMEALQKNHDLSHNVSPQSNSTSSQKPESDTSAVNQPKEENSSRHRFQRA